MTNNQGVSINIKKKESDTTVMESEINRLVYQLYGLTGEEIRIVKYPKMVFLG